MAIGQRTFPMSGGAARPGESPVEYDGEVQKPEVMRQTPSRAGTRFMGSQAAWRIPMLALPMELPMLGRNSEKTGARARSKLIDERARGYRRSVLPLTFDRD